jgi:hypothetical protein
MPARNSAGAAVCYRVVEYPVRWLNLYSTERKTLREQAATSCK